MNVTGEDRRNKTSDHVSSCADQLQRTRLYMCYILSFCIDIDKGTNEGRKENENKLEIKLSVF